MLFVRLLLVMAISYGFIQPLHAQYFIQGKVTDNVNAPLAFATVILRTLPDSAVSKTEFTDSVGAFSIQVMKLEPSLLTVTATGYRAQTQLVASTYPGGLVFKLEPLANMLNGVVVSAQKKLIERKADRVVFNVESSIAAIGSDAYEVLKKAPGVRTSNHNISIAGKSAVSVMINDKLLHLSGEELEAMLRGIPAGNISKIEVITTPPAKYDAEGNTGIINIVMKKMTNEGLNGNITATYEQHVKASPEANGSMNFRKGKWNVYSNGNINNLTYISDQDVETIYPSQKQVQRLAEDNQPWFRRIETGVDYNLNKKSVIGILYTFGYLDRETKQQYVSDIFHLPGCEKDSVIRTQGLSSEKGRRNVIDLNYEWNIDTSGKKLTIDANYFNRTGDRSRDFTTQSFLPEGTATGIAGTNRTDGRQHIIIRTANADLVWPIGNVVVSTGMKTSFVDNFSDNAFSSLKGNTYVYDSAKSDKFDYSENTQAVYVSTVRTTDNWEMQAGLRAENTQTKGVSHTLNQVTDNQYFKLFPTAYIQYEPNEDHSFNLNYSRRIDRPVFWIMNPFREYTTATSYEQGNPFLQPSFSHNVELNYTYKSAYTFTVFAERVSQLYTRVSVVDTVHNSFYFNQANAGTSQHYGISASATINPAKWWEGQMQLVGYYNLFHSSYYNNATSYERKAWSAETSNSFILNSKKTLLAELGAEYTSDELVDFDINYAKLNVWMGVKALLMDKKLVAAINFNDPFKTDREKIRNLYNGTYQNSYLDEKFLSLSLTWKFGNRNVKDKRAHSATDEVKRAS